MLARGQSIDSKPMSCLQLNYLLKVVPPANYTYDTNEVKRIFLERALPSKQNSYPISSNERPPSKRQNVMMVLRKMSVQSLYGGHSHTDINRKDFIFEYVRVLFAPDIQFSNSKS